MKKLNWIRPLTDVQHYPLIYSAFEATNIKNGEKINLRIEDLHEESFNEALKLMKNYYFKNNPMLSSKRIENDEISMNEIFESWKEILQQKISIVCYEENSNEIIGLNFLSVITEEEFDMKPTNGEVYAEVKRVSRFLKDIFFNPFDHYCVKQILTGVGSYVSDKYNNLEIETEMLKVRADIGKMFNIQVTSEIFPTEISQNAAILSEFDENFSIDYNKLPKIVCEGFFPGIKETKLKIMSRKF